MSKDGNIIDKVVMIAIIIILVATLGVAGFNILGNATMVTNYSEPIANLTGPSTIYLSNSDLKANTLHIYNATFGATVTTDYTVVESTGIITIKAATAGGRLLNGTAYSLTYQKDSVPSVVKTLVITVIAIIFAIVMVIILMRFMR